MKLTKSQKKAVKYNRGPLLIIAGAGTGKTTVLVEKVKYLLEKKLAKPEEILLLTFTDKAAREMEERVDQALPYGYFQMQISTFHAFCDKVLREEVSQIGLSPGYRLQTQAQSILFLKQNMFNFDLDYFRPLGNPDKFAEALIQHFSRLRDEDIRPSDYMQWVKVKSKKTKLKSQEDQINEQKDIELAKAFKKFQELKIRENTMDFADLIFYTLQLFRTRANILREYKKKFKFILVDEFQDTNIAQYQLIKLLAPTKSNPHLTVVGDDSQAIYKFRGASVSNILQFMDYYKSAQRVVLLENFRSNQRILDAAYQTIKNNDPDTLEVRLDISKDLKSMTGRGSKDSINFYLADRVEEEADYVADQIQYVTRKNKFDFRDIAILTRANNHAQAFTASLARSQIPYQFLGPGILFKQPEVKDLIAYLKVLYDISDSASLFRILTMDVFNIDHGDLARLTAFTRRTRLSLFETIQAYLSFFYKEFHREEYNPFKKYVFTVRDDTREKLYKIAKMIAKALGRLSKDSAGQILYYFLEDTGYLRDLMSYKTEKQEKTAQNISRFFDRLKTFEAEQEDASVEAVVDYINMSMELGESPLAQDMDWADNNAVNILTVHSSKGLEFPLVFMVNLTTGRFPTYHRSEQIPIPDELIKEILPTGDYHLQEERRLFYVGATRAMKRLYLTAANYYGEAKRERKVSPFVIEALGEDTVLTKKEKSHDQKKQLSIFDFKKREEKATKTKRLKLDTFSYSQLNTYKICPLRYKYQYVLKIPTPPSAAASFGETIHKALQEFYELHRGGSTPHLGALIRLYQESWIPLGYTSARFEEQMKKTGERLLRDFYKKFHQKNIQIVDLEKWFKIKVEDGISIVGKMDRVSDIGNGKLEIVDYKTGKPPNRPVSKADMQLSIYALAASDRGLYHKKIEEVVLTFYFLQNDEKVSMVVGKEDINKVKTEIAEIAGLINQATFDPHVGPWCRFCPFRINCEAWQ